MNCQPNKENDFTVQMIKKNPKKRKTLSKLNYAKTLNLKMVIVSLVRFADLHMGNTSFDPRKLQIVFIKQSIVDNITTNLFVLMVIVVSISMKCDLIQNTKRVF